MRGYFTDNVSDYTKEQCEEYLKNHPNGLRADYVRERLQHLTQSKSNDTVVDEEEYWKHNHTTIAELRSYKNKFPHGKHLEECNALLKSKEIEPNTSTSSTSSSSSGSTTNTTQSYSSGTDGWTVFGKILLSIGAVVLVIFAAYKWHWIGTSIAGPMAYVAIRNIWSEL